MFQAHRRPDLQRRIEHPDCLASPPSRTKSCRGFLSTDRTWSSPDPSEVRVLARLRGNGPQCNWAMDQASHPWIQPSTDERVTLALARDRIASLAARGGPLSPPPPEFSGPSPASRDGERPPGAPAPRRGAIPGGESTTSRRRQRQLTLGSAVYHTFRPTISEKLVATPAGERRTRQGGDPARQGQRCALRRFLRPGFWRGNP
jgi:hypothetical protein